MALTHLLLLLLVGAALELTFFSGSNAGEVGVCYGMMGSNMLPPPAVVQLLQKNGIKSVSLYDANAGALVALANSGIKVAVALPNDHVAEAADSWSYALQWVQSNVKAYPNTLIVSVAVGNEVFHQRAELTPKLLPAMKNIQAALASVGLADAVKVITPIALDALKESWPPSAGAFRDDIAQSVMVPMIDFLEQTGSYLSFNVYPYFAYKYHPDSVDLNFVLFRATQYDSATGLTYHSMFDAMNDAVFHAVEKLDKFRPRGRMLIDGKAAKIMSRNTISESGSPTSAWSTAHKRRRSLLAAAEGSISNAQTYTNSLITRVLTGGGTPYNPDADISVYIFSLFNEDLKGGDEDERNFGLFYQDGTPVYNVDFGGPASAGSWCTANAAVGEKRLQDSLDYACGHGANCSDIQPGKPCYQPDTVVAHASYAFDAYYQSQGRASGSCDFAGAASIVHGEPTGTCRSWCVANAATGDARLQAALDYACGHGADCSAIQAGGRCFDPNTKLAHASYAFNDYYQRKGRSAQSCDFGGCGSVVHQQPKFGNCVL